MPIEFMKSIVDKEKYSLLNVYDPMYKTISWGPQIIINEFLEHKGWNEGPYFYVFVV